MGDALEDWREGCPENERKVLTKYLSMFGKKLKDEPFPEEDKKILRKYSKGFLKFLRSL
jgi:hypothetical protein